MRLKSRQMLPNWSFYIQPEIKFDSRKVLPMQPSFSTLVSALISARRANPFHVTKHGWATDVENVSNEVDAFIAAVAATMPGASRFIADVGGSAPIPFFQVQNPEQQRGLAAAAQKARKLWDGIKTLSQWYDSKEPAVPSELSEQRAKTCSECPLNQPGDLTKWFTNVAAEAIKRQVAKFSERNLKTSYDDKLFTCTGCFCVNSLAVHVPIEIKTKNISEDVWAELRNGKDCWQLKETGRS